MSRIFHPFKLAIAAALPVVLGGGLLVAFGTLLWSLNALLGLATWEKVGYQLGYHGTWVIILTLVAGIAGLVRGLWEVVSDSYRDRTKQEPVQ